MFQDETTPKYKTTPFVHKTRPLSCFHGIGLKSCSHDVAMATLETTSLLGNGAAGGLVSSSVSAESCIPASCSRTTNCAGKITAVFDDITISSNFDSGR